MEYNVCRFWMTKLDARLITSLPASDPGSTSAWGSKRINPRPQFCLCLTWSGCLSKQRQRPDVITKSLYLTHFIHVYQSLE